MKSKDIFSNAYTLADSVRQAALDSQRLGIGRQLAEDVVRAAAQQPSLLETFGVAEAAKSAALMRATHMDVLEHFAQQREQLASAMAGMDLTSINQAIGRMQPRQIWADIIANEQNRVRDLLSGFAQVQQIASQFDSLKNLNMDSVVASHADALRSAQSAVASMVAPSLFGSSLLEKISAAGLGDYSKQLSSVLDGIDFDSLRSIANAAGTMLADDLDEDDLAVTDEPPSTVRLDEAIEHADLSSVREAVDKAVGEALRKALAENPATKYSPGFLYIFIPIFCAILGGIVGAIGSVLLTRWLAPPDGADAAKKTSVTQAKPKQTTRFSDHLAVRGDALPLRMGPSTTQRPIVVLSRGQIVEVLKRNGLWARVRYIDPLHPGVEFTGWIKIKQTQRIEDETIRRIWCALTESASRDADACQAD